VQRKELYSRREAARRIGVSEDLLRKWELLGKVAPVRLEPPPEASHWRAPPGLKARVFYQRTAIDQLAASYVRKIPRSRCRGKNKSRSVRDRLAQSAFKLIRDIEVGGAERPGRKVQVSDLVIELGVSIETAQRFIRESRMTFEESEKLRKDEEAQALDDKRAREMADENYKKMKLMAAAAAARNKR
jgi:hypothetical protein